MRSAIAASAIVTSIGAAIAYQARYRSPYEARLERVEFAGFSLGESGASLRVGFVTDLHIGPAFSARDAERALSLIAAADPDLFLLGGDYVCESPRYLAETAALLSEFVTHARLGALAVLGNHDYSNDAPRLVSLFERGGIRVLRNEATCISTGLREVWIAGIDDAILGRPDLESAFAPIPDGAKSLALWHEPDWAERTASYGALLQLSGHSHGGQVRLPVVGHVAAPYGGRHFVSGKNTAQGMSVYTSRGVGVYRPPIRFRCPPEVTLLTLD